MDNPFDVEVFSSLQLGYDLWTWWNLRTVCVELVWKDVENETLYIVLLDQNVSWTYQVCLW